VVGDHEAGIVEHHIGACPLILDTGCCAAVASISVVVVVFS
jgi:hypothetical protein